MNSPAAKRPKNSVVFVNRYFFPDQSSTSQVLTDLVQGLIVEGFAVRTVCSRQLYGDPTVRLAPQDTAFGARVHRIATTRFGRLRLFGRAIDYATFYVALVFTLLRILRPGDVLVVKTDPPLLSLLAAPIARIRRATLITWQQDVFPEIASHLGVNPLPRWLDGLLRRWRNASLRSATKNVVIGTRMLEHFVNNGVPLSKLCVIENWADPNAIKPKPSESSSLRARLGMDRRFVVCYSGNLGRAHEFETLLVAAQLLRHETTFAFLVIGDGAKMEALKQSVKKCALDSFHFLPYQPRETLEDSLAAADVHLVSLLPELEGLLVPSKLYGILAAGRPSIFIGDPDGDIARVIAGARCGLAIKVGDGQGLADALRRLRANSADCSDMGCRARQLLCDKFTFEKSLERWVALLRT